MIEIFIALFGAVVIYFFNSLWVSIPVLIVVLFLIYPGVFAIFSGAPFVPTPKKRIEAMMRLGDFKSSDIVYELGCGDGRIIREVSRRNVKKAIGYEFSIPTFLLANLRKLLNRTHEKIIFANFWKKDFSDADVIICFLFEKPMQRFEKEIWPKLHTGARVISNEFVLPNVKPEKKENLVYLYLKK